MPAPSPVMPLAIWPGRSITAASSSSMDNVNAKQGFRFLLDAAVTVKAVEWRGARTGAPAGTFGVSIQPEALQATTVVYAPSGTPVTNLSLTGLSFPVTGWYAPGDFASTGSLSANTPYWVVFESTNTLTSTAKYGIFHASDSSLGGPAAFQQNSTLVATPTVWQATPTFARYGCIVLTLSDSSKVPINVYHSFTTHNVVSTTRVGLRFHVDVPTVIRGFWVNMSLSAVASISDLTYQLFDTSDVQQGPTGTLNYVTALGSATVTSAYPYALTFGQDVSLVAGDYWLSLKQSSAVTTDSWQVNVVASDYTGGETYTRGSTLWQVGSRTADSGAWTIPGTFEDASSFGPMLASQSSAGATGAVPGGASFSGGFQS